MSDALRGILWLPLLALFVWLARAGWCEYQNVEAYRRWSASFERAKYDIYAVLGQKGALVTWGKPARPVPADIESFSLADVEAVQLLVDERPTNPSTAPEQGKAAIAFALSDRTIAVPFTQPRLAARWTEVLQQEWQLWHTDSTNPSSFNQSDA
ncbi:hypothetical protein KR51_00007870 [Rubidibacter lacunae KORDI 51-2]|uniref:Uncharacterized protein n=1 Tax=Rubidibacter lacunae KORDI 51-2 TaxID=582515 RepID=U5DLB9_9CHRO|nr:hypothetical protein [Rubidibacter lacunae]ERN42476.1 hypothetical protein KR51_00007870 [Rubidibacter lacunae KORDI 51-2]